MKSFGVKPWMLPQPVLIIGTYNEDGTPNAMNAAWGANGTVVKSWSLWVRMQLLSISSLFNSVSLKLFRVTLLHIQK